MTGALNPQALGETAAINAWSARGKVLVLRPSAYAKALGFLAECCDGGEDFAAARQAFDRQLLALAIASTSIIRPRLQPRRQRRK